MEEVGERREHKGKGYGKGKGGGKNKGKGGLYELDLWGSSTPQGSEWDGWSDDWSSQQGNGLRMLGCLTEKPLVDGLAPIQSSPPSVLHPIDELAPIGYKTDTSNRF